MGMKIGRLAQGVNTRIGSAGTGEGDPMADKGFDGPLDCPLNGIGISLTLPPVIGTAVVLDGEFEVSFHFSSESVTWNIGQHFFPEVVNEITELFQRKYTAAGPAAKHYLLSGPVKEQSVAACGANSSSGGHKNL